MRRAAVLLVGLAPLTAGCNVAYYAGYNLIHEPSQEVNEFKLRHQLKAQARLTWREVERQYPAKTFTHAFKDGFIDGYADHLENGGPPCPPPIPPARYRTHVRFFTPDGQARAKDYLIGFKYGAEVAAATGKREYLTVPVLLPEPPPVDVPLSITVLPSAAPDASAPLPAPRPAGPPAPSAPLVGPPAPGPSSTNPLSPAPPSGLPMPTVPPPPGQDGDPGPAAGVDPPADRPPPARPPAAGPPKPLPPSNLRPG